MPRVSVILPAHNAAATVERAVMSIRGQSFGDWELVAIDDGSSDATAAILERCAVADHRIRVCATGAHSGVVAAAALGLGESSGEFVARMDADDWSAPQRLARQLDLLVAEPGLAAVACGVRLANPQGDGMRRYVEWVNGLATPEDIARERFIEAPVINPGAMLRREPFVAAGGYRDCGWPEDYDLWLRLLDEGQRIGKVPGLLLEWRDGPDRLTRSHEHYATAQVWRLKAHFAARLPGVRERGVAICGGGPIARRCIDLLRAEGVEVRLVFDVDPKRIGGQLRGVAVAGPDEFGRRCRDAVLFSAVGVAGGRERVRRLARGAGFREGRDFWCLC